MTEDDVFALRRLQKKVVAGFGHGFAAVFGRRQADWFHHLDTEGFGQAFHDLLLASRNALKRRGNHDAHDGSKPTVRVNGVA